ncbi:glycerol dehydrogenase [Haloarcula pelagica]|uniref:glycerol dehydrogenase n=1 Tax=Haloarcula pelagica TaxID=3033389 RepID=UPI0024C3DD56|nr:glycerol dehydrogenase [Halomicroarcula sp. YJ-61-S]
MQRAFVAPGRYLQGEGILSDLGSATATLGTQAILVADETVLSVLGDRIEAAFAEAACALSVAEFGGECTAGEIDRLTDIARQLGADVVVGAGGGKALDTAKAVRPGISGALVTVPTIASTDSPTSGLSVLYDADGGLDTGRTHDQRPDLVYVDTAVVAAAPTRFFVSGIGDALATEYEVRAAAGSDGETVAGGRPTRGSWAIATECGQILREQGRAAVEAVERGAVTPAVEDVTEAIILLSGLGFENGGLAAAHAIHDGIATAVGGDAAHGEKVCVGLLAQLALEDRPTAERREIAAFANDVGLPTTLAGVHVDASDDAQLRAIAAAACDASTSMSNQPGNVTIDDVIEALLAVNKVGLPFDGRR